jgi:hypothetical protein
VPGHEEHEGILWSGLLCHLIKRFPDLVCVGLFIHEGVYIQPPVKQQTAPLLQSFGDRLGVGCGVLQL